MATTRTDERADFLSDLLITFTESGSALSWFIVDAYELDDDDRPSRVVITDHEGQRHEIDLDTIAKGIGIVFDSRFEWHGDEYVLTHRATGERLFVSPEQKAWIVKANHENEASYLDAIGASTIVECALFGKVVYA